MSKLFEEEALVRVEEPTRAHDFSVSPESPPKILPDRHVRRNPFDAAIGSFVPFTIIAGCFTDKAMEENSAHALNGELVEGSEDSRFDWPELLPVDRIKTGITEIFLGLIAFAATIAFCCFH